MAGCRSARTAETTLRGQHHDIRGRAVIQKIADARRQHQLIQERVMCNVSVGARKACECDVLGADEMLDHGRIPGCYDKRNVYIARD